jgi:DNA-binding beta-propeller fold protein YncE/transcriptional regulator with XRE-family HTH domain
MAGEMASSEQPSFGDLLKRHRAGSGWTQDQLAERAGVSARAISDLERGVKRYPHDYTVQRLARALELSPGDRSVFEAAARRPTRLMPTAGGDASNGLPSHVAQSDSGPAVRALLTGHRAAGTTAGLVVLMALLFFVLLHGGTSARENPDGSGLGQFHGPTGIAVDRKGMIYVVDRGNDRVQEFDPNGTPVDKWGSPGTGPVQFREPGDLGVDSRGLFFVGDHGNVYIPVIQNRHEVNTVWVDSGGIALDRHDDLYVLLPYRHLLLVLHPSTQDNRVLHAWRLSQVVAGRFHYPAGLTVDARGFVYLADRAHDRLVKLSPNGRIVRFFGRFGRGPGQFDAPTDVAVDSRGNVYVADAKNDRIQVFAPDWRPLRRWGGEGYGPGKFQQPDSIAVDAHGDVYVSDYGNDRVQKFSPRGRFIWATSGRHPITG